MVSIKPKAPKKMEKKATETIKVKKLKKDKKLSLKPQVKAAIINPAEVSTKIKKLKKDKKLSLKPQVKAAIISPAEVSTNIKKLKKDKKLSLKPEVKAAIVDPAEVTKIQKPKKVKFVLPSKHVTQDIVESCIKALHQLDARQKSEKSQILADETPIFAELHLLKIQSSKGNIKFVLPHSTVAVTGEVCLITPDLKKGRKPDHEPTVDKWEEILSKAGVKNIKTVLPMRQLRVEYDQYELKRRLLTQHDFIMVDTRILSHVSHILGNMFIKKHNMLVPVRIDEKKDVKKQIDIGLRTAMLRMGQGETSTILVGHTAMPQKDVQENVMALVKQLNEKFPGGEKNIRSIALKLPLSLSLPIYVTLRPSSTITAPKLKHKKPKDYIDVVDDLSTYPGSKVRVAPDGTVVFKKLTSNLSDEEDMDQEDSDAVLSEKEEENAE